MIVSLKSKQVIHNNTNHNLINVVVENNYMKPENYDQLEKKKQNLKITKQQTNKEKISKKKNIIIKKLLLFNIYQYI